MRISLVALFLSAAGTIVALTWLSRLYTLAQNNDASPLGQYLRGNNYGPEDPCCCDWQLCKPVLEKCVKTCGSLYGEDCEEAIASEECRNCKPWFIGCPETFKYTFGKWVFGWVITMGMSGHDR